MNGTPISGIYSEADRKADETGHPMSGAYLDQRMDWRSRAGGFSCRTGIVAGDMPDCPVEVNAGVQPCGIGYAGAIWMPGVSAFMGMVQGVFDYSGGCDGKKEKWCGCKC